VLKETKTTTQSKIPFLRLQARLPIHKREFSRIVSISYIGLQLQEVGYFYHLGSAEIDAESAICG
jgi:hypothetical protein